MRPDQRGGGTLLAVAVAQLALLLSVALVVLGAYAVAAHHARAVADLSALSGAQARAGGGDACAAARRVAQWQRATVSRCDTTGDAVEFVVTVSVAAPVGTVVAGLPRQVGATAYAGSVVGMGGRGGPVTGHRSTG